MPDTTRRDYVLDRCMGEGRIIQASRADWESRYDRDPLGTERVLAMLAPLPADPADPVQATAQAALALVRGKQRGPTSFTPTVALEPVQRPVRATVAASADPVGMVGQVKAWTRKLFPETAVAPDPQSRIFSDGSYSRRTA